jgi:8-oxo-dGTP pyrophosphatase MutT (NUDIX family)
MATVDELRRALERAPATIAPSAGHAAVSAVFTPDLDLLLLRRAARPGDPWSGNLAFPGGRVEPGEDPFDGARREAAEEVGLHLDPSWALGRLDDLVAVGGKPGMVIRPYVFLLPGPLPDLVLQPDEVAETLRVPLPRLLADEGRGPMQWQRGSLSMTLPKVDLPGTEVPLWGLTLRMVDDLLHRLDGRGLGLDRIR